jgi:hypothetical protein
MEEGRRGANFHPALEATMRVFLSFIFAVMALFRTMLMLGARAD